MRPTILLILAAQLAYPWGPRGHHVINRTAVQQISGGGPIFLKAHEDWIAHWGVIPDSWRGIGDPNSKIAEDPNHGWFQEQFAFLKVIPKSRYEFVIALYDEHRRIKDKEPERAKLMNVRWTGTLPYAAMESYEHMRIAMRRYRKLEDPTQRKITELEIASYLGRLGHYIGDSAMPLHDSIHHDGWVGDNPKDYTRDPRVHGRFESQFVELIELKEADIAKDVKAPQRLADVWQAVMNHIAMSFSHVEEVYELDKLEAYSKKDHEQARKLVYQQTTAAAQLLRDMAHTAWLESETAPARIPNPISPTTPGYNPATGSAPPAF